MKPVYEKLKINNIKYSDIGNIKKFPVIKSLVNILNEYNNKNYTNYCKTIINKYNYMINRLDDNKLYFYYLKLLKDEYIRNVNSSNLPDNLKSHLNNLITGIYRKNIS